MNVGDIYKRQDPQQLAAADVMTPGPTTAAATDPLHMSVRRLPVVSSRGLLTGVTSFDDVIDLLAGQILDVSDPLCNEWRIEDALRP
jgi:hypothetical protein